MSLKRLVSQLGKTYNEDKAIYDSDFNPIRNDVNELFENLKTEALISLEDTLKIIDRNFDPIDDEWVKDLNNVYSKYNINTMPEEDTYFAYLDDIPKAKEMLDKFSRAKKAREMNYDLAVRKLEDMEKTVSSMICLSSDRIAEIKEEINKMKVLITNRNHMSHKEAINIAEQSKIKSYCRVAQD